jgi:hypothetical protein
VGLQEQAAADLVTILSDTVGGFAVPINVVDPDDNAATINGFATHIGTTISPETGLAVAGQKASVVLPIAALRAADLANPRAVADDTLRPWRVSVPSWGAMIFKVSTVLPDKLGCVVCFLEYYKTG